MAEARRIASTRAGARQLLGLANGAQVGQLALHHDRAAIGDLERPQPDDGLGCAGALDRIVQQACAFPPGA
jgi:hypothetical protein